MSINRPDPSEEIQKITELEQAFKESGMDLNSEATHKFLEHRVTLAEIQAARGWIHILINMVPNEYPTMKDLVQAIKKNRLGTN